MNKLWGGVIFTSEIIVTISLIANEQRLLMPGLKTSSSLNLPPPYNYKKHDAFRLSIDGYLNIPP